MVTKIRAFAAMLLHTAMFYGSLAECEAVIFGTHYVAWFVLVSLACWPVVAFWRATESTGWLPRDVEPVA